MLSIFWLLTVLGGATRLTLGYLLRCHTSYRLSISQPVAAVIAILAILPGFVNPITFPFPVSLTLGFLAVDLLLQVEEGAGK